VALHILEDHICEEETCEYWKRGTASELLLVSGETCRSDYRSKPEILHPELEHSFNTLRVKFAEHSSPDKYNRLLVDISGRCIEFEVFNALTQNKAALAFQDTLLTINRARKLFVSRSGRIGTGSAVVMPGDRIVLFSGAMQPMIIRPNGDGTYWLLGTAYVNGVMDGEVWEGSSSLKNDLSSELWDNSSSLGNGLDEFVLA